MTGKSQGRPKPKEEESEFGSGLAICLVKFAEHFENQMATRIHEQSKGDGAALSREIELWANGASDHLYHIKVPKKWARTVFGKKVAELQHKGLEMGHGFTGKAWTFENFSELQKLTREIASTLDVGLWAMMGEKTKLDAGQW